MLDDDYYVAWIDDGDLNGEIPQLIRLNLDTMMAIGMTWKFLLTQTTEKQVLF